MGSGRTRDLICLPSMKASRSPAPVESVLSAVVGCQTFTMTYEWHGDGIHSQLDCFVNLPVSTFPWTACQLLAGKPVPIDRLDDYPPEVEMERQIYIVEKNLSIIFVPTRAHGGAPIPRVLQTRQVAGASGGESHQNDSNDMLRWDPNGARAHDCRRIKEIGTGQAGKPEVLFRAEREASAARFSAYAGRLGSGIYIFNPRQTCKVFILSPERCLFRPSCRQNEAICHGEVMFKADQSRTER